MGGRVGSDLLVRCERRVEEVCRWIDGRSGETFFCSEGDEGRVPGVGRDA
jgi:hypothetical protein